jgi:hypothetical protein
MSSRSSSDSFPSSRITKTFVRVLVNRLGILSAQSSSGRVRASSATSKASSCKSRDCRPARNIACRCALEPWYDRHLQERGSQSRETLGLPPAGRRLWRFGVSSDFDPRQFRQQIRTGPIDAVARGAIGVDIPMGGAVGGDPPCAALATAFVTATSAFASTVTRSKACLIAVAIVECDKHFCSGNSDASRNRSVREID